MTTRQSMFAAYPLTGSVSLSTGPAPTPYHVYDGYGALIGGTANLDAVGQLLASEQVVPLTNEHGQAHVALWLCDFTDASLGPHREFQLSIFVTRKPARPLPASPYALLAAMLSRPDLEMLCHGLWNDTPQVVAYNREHLGLPARLMHGDMTRQDGSLTVNFSDEQDHPLVRALLHRIEAAGTGAAWSMIRLLGPRRLWSVSRQPWLGLTVVNPISARFAFNGRAMTCAHNARNVIRPFNERVDTLELAPPGYADLGFRPAFVQHMTGFQFIYLDPQPPA